MTTMTARARPKLPLWRTIGQSYGVWAKNLPELVRISWLWLLVMIPVIAIINWLQAPFVSEVMQAAREGKQVQGAGATTLLWSVVTPIIMLPMLSSIAVAWHRLLLRHEHVASTYLRFDSVVGGYMILLFLIGLITQAPSLLSQLVQTIGAQANPVATSAITSVFGFVTAAAMFISGRLSLALPAKAIGRDDVTFGVAWQATRRNTWRMFWGYILCILPWGMIAAAVTLVVYSQDHSRLALTVISTALSLSWILIGVVAVGFLSLAYRYFTETGAMRPA